MPGLGDVSARFDPVSGDISFSQDGCYLCAEPNGNLTCNRAQRATWEGFLILSEESLEQLKFIVAGRWIIASRRHLVPTGTISLEPGPALICDSVRLPLRYNLPFDGELFPFRFPVYGDGWRVDQLIFYNPLAFYVAKGRATVDQLLISLESLITIGRFDGKVLVYTDATRQEILDALPNIRAENLSVLSHPSVDWVGFVSGKYSIVDEPVAMSCAPVAYFDPDIVFNAPIASMFIDMACSDRPTAPLEHFSKMATSPSVGAELLREDGAQLSAASGFNAGTFAVPNLRDFGYVFRTIRSLIMNYVDMHGKEALRWVDQEAANYVSYRFAHVDTSDVTKYVRYGWLEDTSRLGLLSGLVHFCGIDRSSRVEPMRRYLEMLKAHYSVA